MKSPAMSTNTNASSELVRPAQYLGFSLAGETYPVQPELVHLDTSYLNGLGYHPARLLDPRQQCTGCGLCAVICPDVCITVYRQRARRAEPEGIRVRL